MVNSAYRRHYSFFSIKWFVVIFSSLVDTMVSGSLFSTAALSGARDPEIAAYAIPYLTVIIWTLPFVLNIFTTSIFVFAGSITAFYEATENTKMAVFCAIMPDAVLVVINALWLVPLFGIKGVWFSYLLGALLFVVLYRALVSFLCKKNRLGIESYMMLPKDYYDAEAVFDVSAGMDAEELARISERIEVFLRQKGASKSDANHTALCLEELAFLIVERNENSGPKAVKNGLIEIVVFMDKDQIKVSVSDNGVPCNYLTYEDYKVEKGYDELSGVGIKLIKRKSKRVDYSRLLEMNVLNISV